MKFFFNILEFDAICFLASLMHFATNLINLIFVFYISRHQDSIAGMVDVIITMIIFNMCVDYALQCLSNYIYVRSEIRLRTKLSLIDNLPPSRINIDVILAVNAISFYFVGPGIMASILIYISFVAYQNITMFAYLSFATFIIAFPTYRYFQWRRGRILRVRQARNKILDRHGCAKPACRHLNGHYFRRMTNFWRYDSLFGSFYVLLFTGILLYCYFNYQGGEIIWLLLVLMFIFRQSRYLFNAFIAYQENLRSLKAIELDLRENQLHG